MNHTLSTYATTDVINEAHSSVRSLRQNRFHVQEYADELTGRSLSSSFGYEDNELISIFVEGLTYDSRQNVQHYFSMHGSIDMHVLVKISYRTTSRILFASKS